MDEEGSEEGGGFGAESTIDIANSVLEYRSYHPITIDDAPTPRKIRASIREIGPATSIAARAKNAEMIMRKMPAATSTNALKLRLFKSFRISPKSDLETLPISMTCRLRARISLSQFPTKVKAMVHPTVRKLSKVRTP